MRAPEAGVARRGRRVPVERQLDLDQHRLDVVGRQRVDFAVDRQRLRQFAGVQIGEQRRRLGVAFGVRPALVGNGLGAEILDQRQTLGDVVGVNPRRRTTFGAQALARARYARMSGDSLAIAA